MSIALEQSGRVYPEYTTEERNDLLWTVPQLRQNNRFVSPEFELLVRTAMLNEIHSDGRPLAGVNAHRKIAACKQPPFFDWPRSRNGDKIYALTFAKHQQAPLAPPITNKFVQKYFSLFNPEKHHLVTRVAATAISIIVSPLLVTLLVTTLALDILKNNEQFFLAYQRYLVRSIIHERRGFSSNRPLRKVDPNNSWLIKCLASSQTKTVLKSHFNQFLEFVDNIASDPFIQQNSISFKAKGKKIDPFINAYVSVPGWELKYPIDPSKTCRITNAREFLEYCNSPRRPDKVQRIFPQYLYITLEESYAERLTP